MANIKKCTQGCEEDRRDFLKNVGKAGLAFGVMGMSLGRQNFIQEAYGVPQVNPFFDCALQIFFSGGPSQTDTWDPKPGSRNNVFNTINLGIKDEYGDDIQISEVFPNLANLVMSDPNVGLGLFRSMSHQNNSHGNGQRFMNCFWEGAPSTMYPSTSAVMSHYFQGYGVGIPSVVINGGNGQMVNDAKQSRVPTALQVNAGGGQGGNPVVEALQLPNGVDNARYMRRKGLLDKLNARYLAQRPDAVNKAYEKALNDAADVTMKGDAARAFDLTGVPLVAGRDNNTRRRLTQAVRLLEAGVPYVSCGIGGNDSHGNNRQTIQGNWGQSVDGGVVDIVNRLKASGKRCLIIMGGEFGRTPASVANGRNGRDHWGDGFSWATIAVNQPKFKTNAIGQTGPDGLFRVRDNNLVDQVRPKDLGGMVYRSLGFQVGTDVAYDIPLNDREAPPVDRVNDGKKLMEDVFGLK
jgi:uncharacterized protein DUF1501